MDYLDITYSGIPFLLMSVVEPSLAVTLACVPLLRPLLGAKDAHYSATGTRRYTGASLSFHGLHTVESPAHRSSSLRRGSRLTRGRSSCPSVPAEMLQYQYEMGLGLGEGMGGGTRDDSQDRSRPAAAAAAAAQHEYRYHAQISTGHESDFESSRGKCSDDLEVSPMANIVVRQEWSVSNEVKMDV